VSSTASGSESNPIPGASDRRAPRDRGIVELHAVMDGGICDVEMREGIGPERRRVDGMQQRDLREVVRRLEGSCQLRGASDRTMSNMGAMSTWPHGHGSGLPAVGRYLGIADPEQLLRPLSTSDRPRRQTGISCESHFLRVNRASRDPDASLGQATLRGLATLC
jgi:hypothetical protein